MDVWILRQGKLTNTKLLTVERLQLLLPVQPLVCGMA